MNKEQEYLVKRITELQFDVNYYETKVEESKIQMKALNDQLQIINKQVNKQIDEKVEQYQCQSYFNDKNELVKCSCGKCV